MLIYIFCFVTVTPQVECTARFSSVLSHRSYPMPSFLLQVTAWPKSAMSVLLTILRSRLMYGSLSENFVVIERVQSQNLQMPVRDTGCCCLSLELHVLQPSMQ